MRLMEALDEEGAREEERPGDELARFFTRAQVAEQRCAGMGWDGMGWDGMGWDGMGWAGLGWALSYVICK